MQVVVPYIHHNVDAAIFSRTWALLGLLVHQIWRFYGNTKSDSIGCLHDNIPDLGLNFFY